MTESGGSQKAGARGDSPDRKRGAFPDQSGEFVPESVVLLGATGSIGTQVLDIIRGLANRFRIKALSGGKNLDRLAEQVREFKPEAVCIQDPGDYPAFKTMLPEYEGEIVAGSEGLLQLVQRHDVDTVIVGLVGLCGLAPSLEALQGGKKLLTANKETFVTGGHLVLPYLSQVTPIDSEHVAIHQCLKNEPKRAVSKIYLTASGGPFRKHSLEEMGKVTLAEALKHPNWTMGNKITVDSATMMNKGLEIIEARWLFGVTYEQVQVVVHPQSIIHSGVEFIDGSILVQMGAPDMHGPIQYAMTYPERLEAIEPAVHLDLLSFSQLDLEPPDLQRFPCIRLAYEAGRMGNSATAVLNGADEVAVQLFLEEKICYTDIARLLEQTLIRHEAEGMNVAPTLDEIHQYDTWARETVLRMATKRVTCA